MGNTGSGQRRFTLPKRRLSSKRRTTKTPPPAHPPPSPPPQAPPQLPAIPQPVNETIVIALYSYSPRTEGDLSFVKDERMVVLDKRGGGWWKARSLSTNQEGFVPMNYVVDESSLKAQPWFFDTMKRTEAEKLLISCKAHSAFLVRRGETNPNDFSLSVLDQNIVKHYRVRNGPAPGKYYITHKVRFETVSALIQHYKTKEDGLCVKLGKPPSKSTPQTFTLSHNTADEWEICRSSLQLIKCLGEGHYGKVWEGLWNGTTAVAIKQLKEGTMSRAEFIREATVMKSLRHSKLVQLYAVCSKEEPIYIIEELMEHPLNKYLQLPETKEHLVIKNLIDMSAQVASGMQYLESKNYIHRDLAARNVLVSQAKDTPAGTSEGALICKIADFGLARLLQSQDKVYEAQNVLQFPVKWTAPEAATHFKFTIKSDVWSFGVLMYEIFTFGGTPYPGMSNQEALSSVEQGYRMQCPSGVTEELYDIMLGCWKSAPADRPTFETIQWRLEDYYFNDEVVGTEYRVPEEQIHS